MENYLTVVTGTVTCKGCPAPTTRISQFTYDGDGARVLKVEISGTQIMTTAYAGAIEVQTLAPALALVASAGVTATQRITKAYYSAGAQLIALRQYTAPTQSVLYFLHGDHLGSVSVTTCGTGCGTAGTVLARQRFDAWGNVRGGSGEMPTDVGFTAQRSDATGLMYYRARYYAPSLGRFVSADTIVPEPGNPQTLNRYAYTGNNPVKYVDPSGHDVDCGIADSHCKSFSTLEAFLKSAKTTPTILKQVVRLNFQTTEEQRSAALSEFALYWHDQRSVPANTRTTSLEAWARSSDFEAILSNGNKDIYMRDMSNVFGHVGQGLDGTNPSAAGSHSIIGSLDSSGFHSDFADPDPANDQVHHTWFSVQLAFYHGAGIAHIGAWWHEYGPQAGGQSDQDWRASWEASFIGQDIGWERLPVSEVGNKIRWRFSTAWGTIQQ